MAQTSTVSAAALNCLRGHGSHFVQFAAAQPLKVRSSCSFARPRGSAAVLCLGHRVIYYLRGESADWTSLRRYSMANGDDTEPARVPGRMYLYLSVPPDDTYAITPASRAAAATSCWSTAFDNPEGRHSSDSECCGIAAAELSRDAGATCSMMNSPGPKVPARSVPQPKSATSLARHAERRKCFVLAVMPDLYTNDANTEPGSATEALRGLHDVLDSICRSAGFRRSRRLQRFLRYVVQQAVSAPQAPLKESQIAREVFDRRADFDPQIDPIVRVEAGRLRLRLTEYYAGPGQDDAVLIELGKRGYLPTFRSNLPKSDKRGNITAASTSAYRLYLKGRYFWGKRTADGLAKAVEYFKRAIVLDQAFSLALLGIADCQLVSATFEFTPPSPILAQVRAAAENVLRQGTLPAEAHATLAAVKAFYFLDWRGAEADFRRAVEIDPNYATAWQWYGLFCCAVGRLDEGVTALRTATERDPLSLMAGAQLACGLYQSKCYTEAEETCGLVIEMEPNFWPAHYFLGLVYEQQKLFAQAVRELRQAEVLSEGNALSLSALAHAHASAGNQWDARKILLRLQQRGPVYVSEWVLAVVHAGLGETGLALELLGRGVLNRSPQTVIFLRSDPRLDCLRSEPPFRELEAALHGQSLLW
jgi:tetratricopeptide (TPR) repeat protein